MNGRYHEAALLYEQAQRLAQLQGTPAQIFECGVWAAISWVDSAHPLRALTLLADLLKEIPPSADPVLMPLVAGMKSWGKLTWIYKPVLWLGT
jgi:hypothetical protein